MTDTQSNNKILLVGLGNPGVKYSRTRHNMGFQIVDHLAHELKIEFKHFEELSGDLAQVNKNILLLKPMTFMNESGQSVGLVAQAFRIHPRNIWVVYDDIDLPLETVRVRTGGGSAGHHGVDSIIERIGSEFLRVRVGVQKTDGERIPADQFVLQNFDASEKKAVDRIVRKVAEMLETFVDRGSTSSTVRVGEES